MDRTFKFWDRMAKRYANQPLENEEAYLEKLREMKGHIDQRSRVLEVGCGTGATAMLLAPYAQRYHAIDYSSRMIAIASEKAARAKMDNLTFECAPVVALDDNATSCDVIVAMNVLHLLKNWREVLHTFYTLLEPGGVLFCNTAYLGDMKTPARHLASFRGFMGLLPMLSVFTQEEFESALEESGFKIFHQIKPGENTAVFVAAVKPPPSQSFG